MKENKGFSLVELILSIAILSIVLTTVTALMLSGSRQFTKGNADATMQREAQLVVNQVEDMVIDTNGGVFYADNTTTRELVLYNAVSVSGTVTYTKEVIEWVAADEEIRYHKWNVVKDSTTNAYVEDSVIYTGQLLAEDISDFEVDLSDIKKEYDKDGNEVDIVQSVRITVGCTGNDGLVTYATNPVTTLRNRMMLSNSPTRIFDNTPVVEENLSLYIASNGSAASVKIQDRVTPVEKGNAYNIHAIVNDTNNVDSLVTWSIEETGIASTIDSSTGLLQVGALESSQYLTIVATYIDNPGKSVKGIVLVSGSQRINSVEILTLSEEAFKPRYDSHVELEGFSAADESALVYKWTVVDSACVNSFADSGTKLTLPVKTDAAYSGRVLTITLTVSAPSLGCAPKSDSVTYLIPSPGDAGDSYLERGKYIFGYNFDNLGFDGMAEPNYTVYFCDEVGNRDYDLDYLIDKVHITSSWSGGYNMEISEDLPANRDYYFKVIIHTKKWAGDTYDYERVFHIPRVSIAGMNYSEPWGTIWDNYSLRYKLYGHYSIKWDPTKYTIEVQDITSNAPAGVTITANIESSYVVDSENNIMGSNVRFNYSGDLAGMNVSDLRVSSMTVKVYMNDCPDVFAYTTLTLTD